MNRNSSTRRSRIVHHLHTATLLARLGLHDAVKSVRHRIAPSRPTVINLLANDICNSRCEMCLIWQRKRDEELSPEQLHQILQDPLFSKIEHVGITGGEPTLRSDLPELFDAVCHALPRIRSASTITNAIQTKAVIERILASAEVCHRQNVHFGAMVSLDGVGEVHDTVRGRKSNFESAMTVLRALRDEGVPVLFGCTITASNAPYVDELLDFVQMEGFYGHFRIAEFINRLYNETQGEYIRSFDPRMTYHLGLFFFRVEHQFETAQIYRKTYRNIRSMLVEGKKRQIGCPYHDSGVVLTSRGELLYCAPKSPVIGSAIETSAQNLYNANLGVRDKIIRNECDTCIHDYHAPVTFKEAASEIVSRVRQRQKYSLDSLLRQSKALMSAATMSTSSFSSKSVLIVGWYGTETAGDKAILWGIVSRLQQRVEPPSTIYLASMYPFVSAWTLKEMDLDRISIVETYTREFEDVCAKVDEVIVGGGPLMDIPELDHLLFAFVTAQKSGKVTRIEGCGIGPLASPTYMHVVAELCRLANSVTLRDQASVDRCRHELSRTAAQVAPDPATDYVTHIRSNPSLLLGAAPLVSESTSISCFLRDWGRDYAQNLDGASYQSQKTSFETELAGLVTTAAQLTGSDVHLLPMHTFTIGGDDRIFNRRFARQVSSRLTPLRPQSKVRFARGPVAPVEILASMTQSRFNICMRFHSVLFAETLGVPYLAIDYTNGGKIKAFMEEIGRVDRLISLQDVAAGRWQKQLEAQIVLSHELPHG